MTDHDFALGQPVRTEYGTEGVINCISRHITGCDRIEVIPDVSSKATHAEGDFYYPAELQEIGSLEDSEIETHELPHVNIQCGNIVRDTITETEGIVTIVARKRYNCPQVCIHPRDEDSGFTDETQWADVPAIEILFDGKAEQFSELQTETEASATGSVGQSKQERPTPE